MRSQGRCWKRCERASEGVSHEIRDRATARALFGKQMRLSPSRVEKFYQCPFQYFCQYGLGAQPRRQAKIDSLEYGTMIHYVLEKVLRSREEEFGLEATAGPAGAPYSGRLSEHASSAAGRARRERFLCLYERFQNVAVLLLRVILKELERKAASYRPILNCRSVLRKTKTVFPRCTCPCRTAAASKFTARWIGVDVMEAGKRDLCARDRLQNRRKKVCAARCSLRHQYANADLPADNLEERRGALWSAAGRGGSGRGAVYAGANPSDRRGSAERGGVPIGADFRPCV